MTPDELIDPGNDHQLLLTSQDYRFYPFPHGITLSSMKYSLHTHTHTHTCITQIELGKAIKLNQ